MAQDKLAQAPPVASSCASRGAGSATSTRGRRGLALLLLAMSALRAHAGLPPSCTLSGSTLTSCSGCAGMEEVVISGADVTAISPTAFSTLSCTQSLTLQGLHVTTLPASVLTGMTSLVSFRVLSCPLVELPVFGSLPSLREVWLENVELTVLDWYWFGNTPHVTNVTVRGSKVEQTSYSFGMSSLTHLEISHSLIVFTDQVKIPSTAPLASLRLNDNIVGWASNNWLSGLGASLEFLDLSDNHLNYMDSELFNGLSNVKTLLLRGSRLDELSDLFTPLTSLETLDLSGNVLRTSPRQGQLPTTLKHLNLSYNAMQSVNDDAFGFMSALETLDLSHNPLTSLPDTLFTHTTALSTLDLRGTHGLQLSEALLTPLASLQEVYLSGASTTLPLPAASRLSGLQALHVEYCSSITVNSALLSLFSGLRSFTCIACRVRELGSDTFQGLNSLESITIEQSGLHTVGDGVFASLPALRRVDLSGNRLSSLSAGVLANLTGVTHLDLSGNRLTSLPSSGWSSPALQILDVSNNDMSDVPVGSWGMTALRALRASGNSVASLPDDWLQGLGHLELVNVSHNPLASAGDGAFVAGGSGAGLSVDLSHTALRVLPASALAGAPVVRLVLRGSLVTGLGSGDRSTLAGLSLTELDMSHLSLRRWPLASCSGLSLEVLHLGSAGVASIPAVASACFGSLREVDLSGNGLTALPVFVGASPSLEVLNVSGNALSSLPLGLLAACGESVRVVDVSGNALPAESVLAELRRTEQLSELRASECSWTDLSVLESILGACPTLRSLSLAGNAFASWTVVDGVRLPSGLRELDMSRTRLLDMYSTFWASSNLLEVLMLEGNPLTHLPEAALTGSRHLKQLSFAWCAELDSIEMSNNDCPVSLEYFSVRGTKLGDLGTPCEDNPRMYDASDLNGVSYAGFFLNGLTTRTLALTASMWSRLYRHDLQSTTTELGLATNATADSLSELASLNWLTSVHITQSPHLQHLSPVPSTLAPLSSLTLSDTALTHVLECASIEPLDMVPHIAWGDAPGAVSCSSAPSHLQCSMQLLSSSEFCVCERRLPASPTPTASPAASSSPYASPAASTPGKHPDNEGAIIIGLSVVVAVLAVAFIVHAVVMWHRKSNVTSPKMPATSASSSGATAPGASGGKETHVTNPMSSA